MRIVKKWNLLQIAQTVSNDLSLKISIKMSISVTVK